MYLTSRRFATHGSSSHPLACFTHLQSVCHSANASEHPIEVQLVYQEEKSSVLTAQLSQANLLHSWVYSFAPPRLTKCLLLYTFSRALTLNCHRKDTSLEGDKTQTRTRQGGDN